MKIKEVIEDLKLKMFKKKKRKENEKKEEEEEKKEKKRMIVKIVKIYLGLSLVLWAVWGQFIFG